MGEGRKALTIIDAVVLVILSVLELSDYVHVFILLFIAYIFSS